MRHLTSIIFLSLAQSQVFAAYQEPFIHDPLSSYSSSFWPTVITDEFNAFVQGVLNETGVHGLSLGIVKPDGSLEFGSWGNRTEDGDPVDPDVSV